MREALGTVTDRPFLTGILVATWLSSLVAGWALAQGGGTSETVQSARPLNGDQQLDQAERALGEGRVATKRIQELVDEARRERDLIRMTCLTDKLAQYNAGLANLEQRIENLRAAVRAGDTGRASHEFTVTSVIRQKQEVLAREVNQCIGQDVYETGDTKVDLVIDGEPDSDPTLLTDPGGYQVPLVPPPSSPLT
jgi:hypothetical protein